MESIMEIKQNAVRLLFNNYDAMEGQLFYQQGTFNEFVHYLRDLGINFKIWRNK